MNPRDVFLPQLPDPLLGKAKAQIDNVPHVEIHSYIRATAPSFSAETRGSAAVGSVPSIPKVGSTPSNPPARTISSQRCASASSLRTIEKAKFITTARKTLGDAPYYTIPEFSRIPSP